MRWKHKAIAWPVLAIWSQLEPIANWHRYWARVRASSWGRKLRNETKTQTSDCVGPSAASGDNSSDTLHKYGAFHQKMGEDIISKRGWGYHGKQMLIYLFITHLDNKNTPVYRLRDINWNQLAWSLRMMTLKKEARIDRRGLARRRCLKQFWLLFPWQLRLFSIE